MASGISVKLPLVYSKIDGPFALTKTFQETIKQNFKNMVLTVKGERIMDPDFGVGLHQLLFENIDSAFIEVIEERIITQTEIYMPFVKIEDVNIQTPEEEPNKLYVGINYYIIPLNADDTLTLNISDKGIE